MKIIIIGAGVIGLTTALKAVENGHEVILIDKNHCPADETSAQNGAQLSYSHAISISHLAQLTNLFKALFITSSSISLKFCEFLKRFSWFKNIYLKKIMHRESFADNYFYFANLSRIEFLRIKEKLPNLDIKNSGSIHLFRKKLEFEKFLKIIKHQKYFKYEILNRDSKKLQNISRAFYKAIYFPEDQSCNTKDFAKISLEFLKNNKNFSFVKNHKIDNIKIKDKEIIEIHSNNEIFKADHYILATGSYSDDFFKKLSLKSPLISIKGYSITLTGLDLNNSLIDHDKKLVYTQISNKVRIAGLYDFCGAVKKIPLTRNIIFKRSIIKNIRKELSNEKKLWIGLRNATFDGFPAIGKSKKLKNLSYNIGHANLGWTVSAASAKIIIDDLKGEFNNKLEMIKASRFDI